MKILSLLLIATLFKELVWQIIVPIWHTPDEQAHFAQLAFYAEKRTLTITDQKNLSEEIITSETLLGTRRDSRGNNKFTYHPEYKIEYTDSLKGKYEDQINSQFVASRTNMLDQEAAGYPPLYYLISLPLYNLLYSQGIIDRLFGVRIISLILNLLLVLTAYKIGREVWSKGFEPLLLATLVSFQPMISFVAAGYHPDNLLNLFYSVGILFCFLILKNGIKLKYLVVLGTVCLLGLWTKILMVFFLPVVASTIIYQFFRGNKIGILFSGLILSLPVIAFIISAPLPYMPQITPQSPLVGMSFWQYLRFRIPKLLFEMWPWYWGVYKWLGITLPPLVLKIITRVGLLVGLGIVLKFYQILKQRNFQLETKTLIFFIISTFSYLLYLVVWDYRLMQSIGYSQGLQGRYLFTNIVPEMAIILIGVSALVPKRWSSKTKYILCALGAGMVILNGVSLFVVARSYYDLSSLSAFVVQASQYKPAIFKGVAIELTLLASIMSVPLYLFHLVKSIRKIN